MSYYENVAQELIKQLKEGTAVWIKPWKPGIVGNMPYNPISGKNYNGMNAIWLASSGYSDPRWMTYKQAQEEGAQVKKGEKGTVIQYWKWQGERIARDDAGNIITDDKGQPKKEYYKLQNPQVFNAVVFNAQQIDGLQPLQPKEIPLLEVQENAEKLLSSSPAPIFHDQRDRAYYTVGRDEIHLPPKESFNSIESYYATALHEVGHSTGHPSRLDRDLANPFGSVEYAKEELRAEIASYMLGMELGIGHEPGQHVAYIESWIKVLNDDPKEIFRASRDAQKIKEYVIGLTQALVQGVNTLEEEKENSILIHNEMEEYRKNNESALINYEYTIAGCANKYGLEYILSRTDDPKEILVTLIDNNEKLPIKITMNYNDTVNIENRDFKGNLGAIEVSDYLQGIIIATKPEYLIPLTIDEIKNNHNKVFDELAKKSVNAFDDYDAMESWENLSSIAKEHNIESYLAKVRGMEASARVVYIKDNVILPMYTEIASMDGKAASYFNNERVPNCYFSSDLEEQKEALLTAIESMKLQQEQNQIKEPTNNTSLPNNDEVFLAIPYAEKEEAKALAKKGGFRIKWDGEKNCWTAPKDADLRLLAKWIDVKSNVSNADELLKKQEAKDNAIKEFKDAIIDMGLELDGEPEMDEKIHRVKVSGDKGNEKSGAYAGFLNEDGGIPGGYIQNFKTGERFNWRSNVPMPKLSPEERAIKAKEQAEKKQAREAEEKKYFESSINQLAKHLKENMTVANNEHPYLLNKDVPAMPGMYIDNKGLEINKQHFSSKGDLIIPIINMNGELVSAQSIKPDGTKSYLKGGHKQGGFFILGDINNSQDLIFAEGLATGESVHLACNKPVIVTFDSGNLIEVSKNFKDVYKDKNILIASDNDQLKTLELDPQGKPKKNAGLEAGLKAVENTNGQMLHPPLKMTDKGSDWNDYQKIYGKESLKNELDKAIAIAYRNFDAIKISKERETKQKLQDNKINQVQEQTQTKKRSIS